MWTAKTVFLSMAIAGLAFADHPIGETGRCYRNKKTILKAHFMGKMTDNYFKLKKGNYFVLYTRLLGLTKMESYTGYYSGKGDTLLLNFCSGTPPKELTGVAIIDRQNKEVILRSFSISQEQHLQIQFDNR